MTAKPVTMKLLKEPPPLVNPVELAVKSAHLLVFALLALYLLLTWEMELVNALSLITCKKTSENSSVLPAILLAYNALDLRVSAQIVFKVLFSQVILVSALKELIFQLTKQDVLLVLLDANYAMQEVALIAILASFSAQALALEIALLELMMLELNANNAPTIVGLAHPQSLAECALMDTTSMQAHAELLALMEPMPSAISASLASLLAKLA